MLDSRTKEEKEKAARDCYASLRAAGRRSCSGCHLDFYCQMSQDSAQWLREFLASLAQR
jgi:hypothetical protein